MLGIYLSLHQVLLLSLYMFINIPCSITFSAHIYHYTRLYFSLGLSHALLFFRHLSTIKVGSITRSVYLMLYYSFVTFPPLHQGLLVPQKFSVLTLSVYPKLYYSLGTCPSLHQAPLLPRHLHITVPGSIASSLPAHHCHTLLLPYYLPITEQLSQKSLHYFLSRRLQFIIEIKIVLKVGKRLR